MTIRKTTWFFLVDAIAFSLFILLAATGLLIRYVLPPGTGHSQAIWGMGRHEWGEVHFWIAIGLLAALAIHVFFHWRWVVSMVRGKKDAAGSGRRLALAVAALVLLLALAALPFVSPIEKIEGRGGGDGHRHEHEEEMIGEAIPIEDGDGGAVERSGGRSGPWPWPQCESVA